MNKRGQSLGISIISVLFFLVIAFSSINFIMDRVTDTTTDLNCDSASTISDGTKFLCLMTDTTVVYFIMCIMSVILGTITARLLI
jgi:ABC-type Fe3+ transport system permease subunit